MEIRPTQPMYRRANEDASPEKPAPGAQDQAEKPAATNDGVAGGATMKLGDSPAARIGGARPVQESGEELPTGETPASKEAKNRAAGSHEGRPVNADYFARDARIREALGGGPTGPEGRFGSKDGGSLTTGAKELPAHGIGKNKVSPDGQRSADGDAAPPPEREKEPDRPITFGRIWAEIAWWLGGGAKFKDDKPNVGGPRGTPDPTREVGVRDAAFDLHHRPSVADAIEARQRQVGQPGEGNSRERVHVPHDVAVKEGLRRPTDGRTTPVDGDVSIPKLKVNAAQLFDQTEAAASKTIKRGFYHVAESAPLCSKAGVAVVAAHRSTWGGSLRRINKLVPGDELTVRVGSTTCTYRLIWSFVVPAKDTQAFTDLTGADSSVDRGRLAVYSCTNRFGTATGKSHRFVALFEVVG